MKILPLAVLAAASFATMIGCSDASTTPKSTAAVDTVQTSSETDLPALPLAIMQKLVDSVDHVDYVFFELTFSMSMDQQQGINYSIAKIGEAAAVRSPNCAPIGRVFYEIKGNSAANANLYFSQGCTYLEFLGEDDKPIYANVMSQVGKDFLNQQFSQIIKDFQRVE